MTSKLVDLLMVDQPRIAELVRGFSLEASSHDEKSMARVSDVIPKGSDVYLPWIPGDTYHPIADAAVRLSRSGLNPVPHIAARRLRTREELQDYLLHVSERAAVRKVLIIAGDDDRTVGPFSSSLDILETGLLERNGITHVGFGGHPEGHPRVSDAIMFPALINKLERARERGIVPYITTQFCFEPDPIVTYVRRVRSIDPDVEIRIGLAGPATFTTLTKFALRCGIGNSMRALTSRGASLTRLLTESNPGQLIGALAHIVDHTPSLRPIAYHFFPFGGIERLTLWLNEQKRTT